MGLAEDQHQVAAWPRWLLRSIFVIAAAFSLLGLSLAVELTMIRGGWWEAADSLGVKLQLDPDVPLGSIEVKSVRPGSAADRINIQRGDLVRYDNVLEMRRIHRPGDQYGLTVTHEGKATHHVLVYAASIEDVAAKRPTGLIALNFLATISAVLFAWLILIKRGSDPAALLLGLVMLGVSLPTGLIPSWIVGQFPQLLTVILAIVGDWWTMLALPLSYYLSARQNDRKQARIAWGGFAIAAILSTIADAAISITHNLPFVGLPGLLYVPTMLGVFGGGIVLLARNYSHASVDQKNRIKIIGSALALYLGSSILGFADFFGWAPPAVDLAVRWGATLSAIAVPALLAYAIVRKGLFDFTFAINRTLIYGAISLILLCGFGLAEWAVHHLVPESWQEAGPVYSAGIALALFLAFHRIRDFVERNIEQLFFRSWHRNEKALIGFVRTVPHYEKAETLAQAAVGELMRFSTGATVSLAWRDENGSFRPLAGTGSHALRIDADDPALVEARTTRAPLIGKVDGTTIESALLLPIFDHHALEGFFAMCPKPQSLGYRPDEIEALTAAAAQIGSGLQSLKVEAMRDHLQQVEARLGDLQALLKETVSTSTR